MRSSRHSQNGFTCIEIMVAVLVVGLLATIVIQSLTGASYNSKRAKARVDMAALEKALDLYYIDNGYYPTTDQGLSALVTPPTRGILPLVYYSGGYLERLPTDPWGNPYFYQSDGNSYVLKSLGPDGIESTDDIFPDSRR